MEHTDLELYIQIRNGQPYEHPIFADNFRAAFPDVQTNNLPTDRFAKFIRVDAPEINQFEVYEGVTYEWVGDVVKDVHHVRPMTDEERVEKTKLSRILIINDMLVTEKDETAQKLWSDCLVAHETWVMENANPITPPFPLFPRQDEAGNWFAP